MNFRIYFLPKHSDISLILSVNNNRLDDGIEYG